MKAGAASLVVALLITAIPGVVAAQSPAADSVRPQRTAPQPSPDTAPHPVPRYVRQGKWAAAGAFVAATALGLLEHHSADNAFDDLRGYCASTGPCSIGSDGRYSDAGAEAHYQRIVSGDRAARSWFIAGQVALAGSAALFVVELLHTRGARNIPYSGLTVTPGPRGTRIGIRLPLRLP